MTKRLLAILLACILVLGITACGESAESGFSVKNELAFEVHSLYIVPAGAAEWGEDLLVAALPSGNSVALALPSEGKAGEFDIRLIDADGDDYYFYGVPIASGTSLRVEYNDNWDCVIVASPKKGDAVTVKGEFQFSGSMGNDEPEDEEFFPTIGGASEVGDFGGGIQDKDYSLGIAAIYPDGFGSVLDESEKAFIVHDNSENCVVILNVTEEYLSYSQLDNDFLYECIGYYVSEYFNYIYGDGSESGMGDVTYGQGGPDRRLATATVNLFNETNDMDVYVILESLTNEDGSDGYYVAAYFSQYGETDQADSIRQVSYYGLNN